MKFQALLIIFLLIAGSSFSPAQQLEDEALKGDTILLEEFSIHVLPFKESYFEATGGIDRVSTIGLAGQNTLSSSDLFDQVPGLTFSSGTLNTNRLVIRGVGSRTPYNTNRIRAYLDDIPLTSGDGISILEDQDLLSLGSLEVLKGPSSAMYGSGLGGVIRLNSPYPQKQGLGVSLFGEAAAFGEKRYGITGKYRNEHMALAGGVSSSSREGFRENSAFERENAFLSARLFWAKHTLSLTFSLIDLYAEIPSSLNEADYLNEPEKAGGSWGSTEGYEAYGKILMGASLETRLGLRLENRFTLFSSYADPYERRPFNILDELSLNAGFREKIEFNTGNISLSGGLEYFHEWFNWRIYETLPAMQGDLLSDQSEQRSYINGFTMLQWRPAKRMLLDAGLNVNILNYSLLTNFSIDGGDQSGSYRYKPTLSPRIGFSYMHRTKKWSYISMGHGFSAPSLEETLLPGGMINMELRPETGWNFEFGNRGFLYKDRVEYNFALYSILLKDLLVTERLSEDVFTGINAGKALNSGMEIMLEGSLFPSALKTDYNAGARLGFNFSRNIFLDFMDDEAYYSGNFLPGIPLQELHLMAYGSYRSISIRLNFQHTGKQWINDANDLSYKAYQLIHLMMNWEKPLAKTGLSINIHAGVRNLFDTHYAGMILINAPAFGGSAPRYYYPGLPRQFQTGIRLSYNFAS